MRKRKVGIMGGSFDPIHIGHLVAANEALNIYKLDEIIFVPAGNPPHKKGLRADSFHRLLMVNMAVLTNDKFSVSDFEIKNSEKSYTLNTLREFHKLYANTEFYFITGTDAVIDLPNWHEPEELLKICSFIAVSRPGMSMEDIKSKISEIQKKLGGNIEMLQVPMLQISSTNIRERFEMGISAKYLLPEAVEQYIIKNELYIVKEGGHTSAIE
jgi:nicotinate-nucleotide adenylyltransferase